MPKIDWVWLIIGMVLGVVVGPKIHAYTMKKAA
jgi:hypothetical protein